MTDHTPSFAMLGCMCDLCIAHRVRQKVREREMAQTRAEYEKRRGGTIGSISVADALASREQK